MIVTTTIVALLALAKGGDRTALPALADALEEADWPPPACDTTRRIPRWGWRQGEAAAVGIVPVSLWESIWRVPLSPMTGPKGMDADGFLWWHSRESACFALALAITDSPDLDRGGIPPRVRAVICRRCLARFQSVCPGYRLGVCPACAEPAQARRG